MIVCLLTAMLEFMYVCNCIGAWRYFLAMVNEEYFLAQQPLNLAGAG
jgi:hypothetical protein